MLLKEFPVEQDLTDIDRALTAAGIVHRFIETGVKQQLWLLNESDAGLAMEIVEGRSSLTNSETVIESSAQSQNENEPKQEWPGHDIKPPMVPTTLILIALGIAGFASVYFGLRSLSFGLAFLPPDALLHNGQWWRLLTPVFLHFSIMHIIFNGLWIWEVGKRLEVFMGPIHYLILFTLCGLAGNLLQFYLGGSINFGGLSGVVYGYFGCIFFLYRKWPVRRLHLPPGMFVFMLVFLVLGFLGIFEAIFGMGIANWAHLGGLLAGVAYGYSYSQLIKNDDKVRG